MDESSLNEIESTLSTIGRALAFLCLTAPGMENATMAKQARLLHSLGLDNAEIASLLDTTPNTVAVRLAEGRKSRGEAEGHRKRGKDDKNQ